ncbi:MAG: hypothetical protein FWD69_12530 [Polyangiaceae bacterium]|nr:hypothetical protein [Polyangiaceae bacterium]
MDGIASPEFDVKTLFERLRGRLMELHPLVVTDVVRVFLEISLLPCEKRLWSLAFAFDEDEGRVAHLEARFASRGVVTDKDLDHLQGYDVEVLLPKFIMAIAPTNEDDAVVHRAESEPLPGSLVAKFVDALSDLGAYRTIEMIEAHSATVYLF